LILAPRSECAQNMPKMDSKLGSIARATCSTKRCRGSHAPERAPPWLTRVQALRHALPSAPLLHNCAPERPSPPSSPFSSFSLSPPRSATRAGVARHGRLQPWPPAEPTPTRASHLQTPCALPRPPAPHPVPLLLPCPGLELAVAEARPSPLPPGRRGRATVGHLGLSRAAPRVHKGPLVLPRHSAADGMASSGRSSETPTTSLCNLRRGPHATIRRKSGA